MLVRKIERICDRGLAAVVRTKQNREATGKVALNIVVC